jgi:hypothetical protein
MSTRYDVLADKAAHGNHVNSHHCRTGEGCLTRLALWNQYMSTADLWGSEPGDDERQRQQFASQQKEASP